MEISIAVGTDCQRNMIKQACHLFSNNKKTPKFYINTK